MKDFAPLRAEVSAICCRVRPRTQSFDGNDEIHFGMGSAVELAECFLFRPVIPVAGAEGVVDIFGQALEMIAAVSLGDIRLHYKVAGILQLDNRTRKGVSFFIGHHAGHGARTILVLRSRWQSGKQSDRDEGESPERRPCQFHYSIIDLPGNPISNTLGPEAE